MSLSFFLSFLLFPSDDSHIFSLSYAPSRAHAHSHPRFLVYSLSLFVSLFFSISLAHSFCRVLV
jgi:hypothetical protein